jgi:Holliday junction resolvasome RuvABC DNA-binding subunit
MVVVDRNNLYDVQVKLFEFAEKVSCQTTELFLKLMEENGLGEDEAVVLVSKTVTDMAGAILARTSDENMQDFFTEACKNMAESMQVNLEGKIKSSGMYHFRCGNA